MFFEVSVSIFPVHLQQARGEVLTDLKPRRLIFTRGRASDVDTDGMQPRFTGVALQPQAIVGTIIIHDATDAVDPLIALNLGHLCCFLLQSCDVPKTRLMAFYSLQ